MGRSYIIPEKFQVDLSRAAEGEEILEALREIDRSSGRLNLGDVAVSLGTWVCTPRGRRIFWGVGLVGYGYGGEQYRRCASFIPVAELPHFCSPGTANQILAAAPPRTWQTGSDAEISLWLQALLYDAIGRWERAHGIEGGLALAQLERGESCTAM